VKKVPCPDLESMRQVHPILGESPVGEMYGFFARPLNSLEEMRIISSGHAEWEHVSVSIASQSGGRTPWWEEMAYVKGLFWGDDETVLQFHPKRSEYVDVHPHCLHLWKRAGTDHILPPRILLA